MRKQEGTKVNMIIKTEKKIKVLHIIHGFTIGGAEKVVLDCARWFKDNPYVDIKVMTLEKEQGSEFENIISKEELDVDFATEVYKDTLPKALKLIGILLKYPRNQYRKNKIYNKIREYNPDIVHVHITSMLNYAMEPIIKSQVGIRLCTIHGMPERRSKKSRLYAKLAFTKHNFLCIGVTEKQIEHAKRSYGLTKYEIIRNGIEIDKYKTCGGNEKGILKKRLGFEEKDFVIGCVARLSEVKNHCYLLKVFERVIKKNSNAKLLLLGDGEERNKLEEYAKELGIYEKVFFAGNKSNVVDYYNIMNAFVLTSKSESSSIVTVEAQLMKIRCVTSTAIPQEVIISNAVKQLSINLNPEIWADSILHINDDIDEVKIYDAEKFSLYSSMEKLQDLYIKKYNETKGISSNKNL